jgi:uncharacterized membrane protein
MAGSYTSVTSDGRLREAAGVDLLVVAIVAVTVQAAISWLPSGHPALVPLGIAFVFVVPGYAIVAALFPGRARMGPDGAGVDLAERLTYAFGIGIAVVPVVGLALGVSAVGFWIGPFVSAVTAVTLLAVALAVLRRRALPVDERFDPLGDLGGTVRSRDPDWLVLCAVGLVLVATVGGVGYAATRPAGETYSGLYLLSEGADGGPVAANFPDEVAVGEPVRLTVGIENGEGRVVSYSVVAVLERVGADGSVTDAAELGRWSASVADGDTWELDHVVRPTFAGENLRLAYLLYVDDPPAPGEATSASTDRSVFVRLDVTASAGRN